MVSGCEELRLGAVVEAGGPGRGVESGRVAKVLVNARSVAPNRRATRRRLACEELFVNREVELEFTALEKLLLCPNQSLQRKSLSGSPSERNYTRLPHGLRGSLPQRLKLNSCRWP